MTVTHKTLGNLSHLRDHLIDIIERSLKGETFVPAPVGRMIVLKMDLRDFFVSITSARLTAIYLTVGYLEPIARLLTDLCTNTVRLAVCNQAARHELDPARSAAAWHTRRLYRQPHLPQ